MSLSRRLIIYAKRPRSNYAKVRLGSLIGMMPAAGVYARLLYSYLLDLLRADLAGTEIELAVASQEDIPFFATAFPELMVRAQVEGDLGQRMRSSFEQAFAAGRELVVLTGSDIPGLGGQTIRVAFYALQAAQVIIGPASDGGCYLIGMRAWDAPLFLFEEIDWSTERVLRQTEVLAAEREIPLVRLPEKFDIDTDQDLEHWQDKLKGPGRSRRRHTG